MAVISQTTLSIAFSWMKMSEFRLNFTEVCSKGPIYNIPALVQIMAWRRPLSEPVMVSLLTHRCVTRPQWVKTIKDPWWCLGSLHVSLLVGCIHSTPHNLASVNLPGDYSGMSNEIQYLFACSCLLCCTPVCDIWNPLDLRKKIYRWLRQWKYNIVPHCKLNQNRWYSANVNGGIVYLDLSRLFVVGSWKYVTNMYQNNITPRGLYL